MIEKSAVMPAREEGRRKTAFLLGAGFALAAVALLLVGSQRASATGDSMIGIDMSPGTGTSSSSSDIATCAQVQPGDAFDADIFVSNAQNLVEWELRVDYNPDVVSLESADYGYFLTQSGGGIAAQLFDSEGPGRKFLAAAEPRFADSGSGVLARLHLVARAQGNSPLTITSAPTIFGPKLQSSGGVPFADFNGDSIFDGGVSGATVAVGRSCGASTPVVTPSAAATAHPTATTKPGGKTPTPGPGVKTPTPTPRSPGAPGTTATGAPGDGGSGTGAGGSGTDGTGGGEQPTPRASEFVRDAPGDTSGDGRSGNSNGSSSNEGTSPDNPSVGNGQAHASGGGSDSTTLILVVAGAFAALCVLLGATFLIMRGSPKQ